MYKIDLQEIKDFLNDQPLTTKVYLGCDSERININNTWYADYALVVVCHINGKNGCKIFGEIIRERDFDQKIDKPNIRLMTEVFKISELYLKLAEVLQDRYVEIHLDLNPSKKHNSNAVLQQAIGYIRGTCNVIPMIKPKAWAASTCADRLKELRDEIQKKAS
jgi:predicted RNase H-related nuclease YkuK (DUF458 family)